MSIYKFFRIDIRLNYLRKYDFTEFHTRGKPMYDRRTKEVYNEYKSNDTEAWVSLV